MINAALLLLSAGLGAVAQDTAGGDFNVTAPGLYPEKCVYDAKRSQFGCSKLYESTVSFFDASSKNLVKDIAFQGLSGLAEYHTSGVLLDGQDNLLVSVNTGNAFDTSGANITGTNYLVIYNLASDKETARIDLSAVTNGTYGGAQDFAMDDAGNIYVVHTYPGALLRVTPSKEVIPWFLSGNTDSTKTGFTGVACDGKMLLASDQQGGGRLMRFSASDAKGQPFEVPLGANATLGEDLDGISMPAKYKNTILLVTSSQRGTDVLLSKDGKWDTAQKIGNVPNRLWKSAPPDQAFATSTFEMQERIYHVLEYFTDEKDPGKLSGNRESFPFVDITSDIDKIVQQGSNNQTSSKSLRLRFHA